MRTLALSDLHLGRTTSCLQRPEQIAPLLEGFGRILLLGDIVDEWYTTPAQAGHLRARVREICRRAGAREVFWCRGNHDSNARQTEEYALLDGVLYLHGHAVYHRLKGEGTVLERMRALNDRKFGPDRRASRLNKRAWSILDRARARIPQALLVPLVWSWPIRRRIMALVREVSAEGAIGSIVLGHSHLPGVRRVGRLHVFNLGGWMRNAKAFGFVRDGRSARLVRIENRRGEARWGNAKKEILL